MLSVYTDGAAPSNSQTAHAGFAYMIPKLNYIDGGFLIGSNNVAELTAIQRALSTIYQLHNRFDERNIEIVTDSGYCITVLSKEAKLNANVNLILCIRELIKKITECGFNISFRHIKSHGKTDDGRSDTDTLYNNIVDNIAVKMAKSEGNYTVKIIDNKFGFDFKKAIVKQKKVHSSE
jgi:ribonuclease HI